MARPSIYEFAGGEAAFLALAAANHERCVQDPMLNHPFARALHPEHLPRLASYWAEVFGGPPRYTEEYGGHSHMLTVHAGNCMPEEMGRRFVACFVQAADDAGLPEDREFRTVLREYMEWAVADMLAYNNDKADVPAGRAVPRWSWDGLQSS